MEGPEFIRDLVCRACAKHHNDSKIDLSSSDIYELYIWCSKTPEQPNDTLPKQICYSCYLLMIGFKRFQEMCVESYKKFVNCQAKYVVATEENTFEITIKSEKDEELDAELQDDKTPVEIKCENIEDEAMETATQILNDESNEPRLDVTNSSLNQSRVDVTNENDLLSEPRVDVANELLNKDSAPEIVIPEEEEAPYNCGECHIISWNKTEYETHLESHTPLPLQSFSCNQCSATFLKKESYENHKSIHIVKQLNNLITKMSTEDEVCSIRVMKPVSFVCNVNECHQKFKSPKALRDHLLSHPGQVVPKRKYRNKPLLVCKFCRNAFSSTQDYKEHRQVHNGIFQIYM